ncbi:hypothetical protein CPE2_0385 [Chlamydia pecorum W73]|uniref:CPBP family intramembrane glutamic endopeptidase n=1 Tax=Chlamydia pecorum TaxID=85991 RepID=UPI0003AE0278|nr:type II CAAX endopeptidase family protein [Chlamydia pecorum]AGW38803.1 hypothetical protein CPE2_0385 [Chlamydia pecorum W73]
MQTSLFFLLLFLLLAAILSKNFFVWPPKSDQTPLKARHVLSAVVLYFFATFLAHVLAAPSSPELIHILVGITLAFSFLTYIFFLPIEVSRAILFSGDQPIAHVGKILLSSLRMWVITTSVTELMGILLNKFLMLSLSLQGVRAQAITEEIQSRASSDSLIFILSIGILIPIGEELFFRGILQTFLKGKLGRVWALVMTSVIFALSHIEHSLGSLVFIPILFVFSLCAGFLYEKERNILAPIFLHVLYNLTSLGLLFLG